MKHRRLIRLLVGISAALLGTMLSIQAQQISVNSFPLLQQLPSNSSRCILEDKEGIIWLGTADGLCRYDAYRVSVFRSNIENPNRLSNNDITCLAEDTKGRILIGTKKGLNVLDKSNYQITLINHPELSNDEIKDITVDQDGSIWVGTFKHLVRCSTDLSTCKSYDNSLPVTSVNSIYRDQDDQIWVMFWSKGLYKYDREKDSFTAMPAVGNWNNPFKILQDKEKRFWLATWGEGIYRMYPDKAPEKMFVKATLEENFNANALKSIFGIVEDDRYGYLWMIGNLGLTVINYEDEVLKPVDISSFSKGLNNIFSQIIKASSGDLWIAAFNEGAYTISLDNPVIRNYEFPSIRQKTGKLTTNIRAFYCDADNDVWVSQNRWGLGIYFQEENTLKFYDEFPTLKNLDGITTINNIRSFTPDAECVWIGAEFSPQIHCIRKVKNNLIHEKTYDLKPLGGGNLLSFYQDTHENIWIITTAALLVKPAGKEIQKVNLALDGITSITEDGKGRIWLSSQKEGIVGVTFSSITFQPDSTSIIRIQQTNSILPTNNIEVVCTNNEKDRIWIGTKEGHLLAYQIDEQKLKDYSSEFKSAISEGIQNMVVDTTGHLWISTNKRIIEYNPQTSGKFIYTSEDGIVVNSFLKNSYFYDGKDQVYFGGNKGISIFTNYKRLAEDAKVINVLITDVKTDGQSMLQYNQETNCHLDADKRIIYLESGAKNIELDFSACNYSYPNKIMYAYRMKGIDDNWIYTNGTRQFAYYNRLPKGKHTLEIKATDLNGLWSDKIIVYTLIKKPALYETWYAYMLYTILLVTCIFSLFRWFKGRMELRNELRIAQINKEKSEDLTQTKLRYFTNISHDFLTPITIISCLINDMEMTYTNQIPQLGKIRSNLNKLQRLIQQVLDFRKMESGNMQLKVMQGNLVSFIRQVCEHHFAPLMEKKYINFTFSTDTEHIPAYFDEDKIEKIMFNLLSNAYKYTDQGGSVQVELSVQSVSPHPYVTIRVSDTGKGIAAADVNKIFNRFFTPPSKKLSETNGIGLSLTKDLLTLHHATIDVESALGKGSTFIIQLYIDKDSYSLNEIISTEQMEIKDLSSLPSAPTQLLEESFQVSDNCVLIVEDNEELQEVMSQILSHNYKVLKAMNGLQALAILEEHEVDLIISDVAMPEMDGITLCRHVKENIRTSHIPIIMLTAMNTSEDRIVCYDAGADGYIAKPFELEVLEARIRNFMTNKRIRQEKFKMNFESDADELEASSIDQKFIKQVISIVESEMTNVNWDMNKLADELCMSKSSLYRKIKSITGLSPIEFVKNIRLKYACKLLCDSSISIGDAAYASGFSNPKYFSTCFKEAFNITPKEFQKDPSIIKKMIESTDT